MATVITPEIVTQGPLVELEFIEPVEPRFYSFFVYSYDLAKQIDVPFFTLYLAPMNNRVPNNNRVPGANVKDFHAFTVEAMPVSIELPYFVSDGPTFYTFRVGNVEDLRREARERERALIRQEISGYQGPTLYKTRAYVSDKEGRKKYLLDGIRDLSVNFSNYRDNTWETSITVDKGPDFNPFTDWVKVEVEAHITGVGVKTYEVGLYHFFDDIGSEHFRDHTVWSLTGTSGEGLLVNDTTRNVFTVPKGAKILKTVKNLLLGLKIPASMIALPMDQDKELRNGLVFDPFQDEENSSKLGIINKLLNAGGWYALYTLGNGVFTTIKIRDLDKLQPDFFYGPPDEGGEPLLINSITDSYNMEGWANAVIVTSEDPVQAVEEKKQKGKTAKRIRGIAEDLQSYNDVGYWKVKRVKYKHIVDQEEADRLAKAQLKAASHKHRTVSYTIFPDPEHFGPKMSARLLHYTDDLDTPIVRGVFKDVNASWNLHPRPKEIVFESSRSEDD